MRTPSRSRRRPLAWALCALVLFGAAAEGKADGPPTRHVQRRLDGDGQPIAGTPQP